MFEVLLAIEETFVGVESGKVRGNCAGDFEGVRLNGWGWGFEFGDGADGKFSGGEGVDPARGIILEL